MTIPLKVGITHGDINSISYEVIIKALEDERIAELFTPIIFGTEKVMNYWLKALNRERFEVNVISDASEAKEGVINLVNMTDTDLRISIGEPTQVSGLAALLSIDTACKALEAGKIDVIVTAPINKEAIHSDEFQFRGQTEYFGNRFGREGDKPLMVLFAEDLRVALVTGHMPITEIGPHITKDNIVDKIRRFEEVLKRDFRIEKPRIAVLGLNPHCGDHGVIGMEDDAEIRPAIKQATEEGILAYGPFSPDGFFGLGDYRHYDGILAMYHDQGLAPFKALVRTRGVNFTGGLDCIRTSPDHGTAYEIAGKGIADATSMRQAMYAALDIYRSRTVYEESKANPLPMMDDKKHDRRNDRDKEQDEPTVDATEPKENAQTEQTEQ